MCQTSKLLELKIFRALSNHLIFRKPYPVLPPVDLGRTPRELMSRAAAHTIQVMNGGWLQTIRRSQVRRKGRLQGSSRPQPKQSVPTFLNGRLHAFHKMALLSCEAGAWACPCSFATGVSLSIKCDGRLGLGDLRSNP